MKNSKFDKDAVIEPNRFFSMPSIPTYADADGERSMLIHGYFDYGHVEVDGGALYAPKDAIQLVKKVPDTLLEDLMKTNPRDVGEIEAFMNRYGLLYSVARHDFRRFDNQYYAAPEAIYSSYDTFMVGGSVRSAFGTREAEAIRETYELACSIAGVDGEKAFRIGDYLKGMKEFSGNHGSKIYPKNAVSEAETAEALATVQRVVQTIIEAKKVGYSPSSIDDGNRLGAACSYASEAVKKWVFFVAPVYDGEPLPVSVPALIAALAQAIQIAIDDEPLKQCPECGGWFQYKKGGKYYRAKTKARCHRERRAVYCSLECQTKHNNKVQRERRAAEKAAAKSENGCRDTEKCSDK